MRLKSSLAAIAFAFTAVTVGLPATPAHADPCLISTHCVYQHNNYGGGYKRLGNAPYFPVEYFDNGLDINDRVSSLKNRWIGTTWFYTNAWYDGDSLGVEGGRYHPSLPALFNEKFSSKL